MASNDSVAHRELRFSRKGTSELAKLVVKISAPYLLDSENRNVQLDPGAAACTVIFEGIHADEVQVHGIDLLHALAQAVDIDRLLKAMTAEYDFYWPSGEPYFE